MAEAKICDRCDKVHSEGVGNVIQDKKKDVAYDLCPRCASEFRDFMDGATPEFPPEGGE